MRLLVINLTVLDPVLSPLLKEECEEFLIQRASDELNDERVIEVFLLNVDFEFGSELL